MALNITAALIRDLNVNLNAAYDQATQKFAPSNLWATYTSVIPSDTLTEKFDFSDQLGTMIEFLDERQRRDFGLRTYQMSARKWELTIDVKRDEIADDQLGLIRRRVESLAARSAIHKDVLSARQLNEALAGGSTEFGTCFDGQPFFSNSHTWANSEYTTAQDNLRSGTNTGKLTAAYAAANLKDAINTMQLYKDNTGEIIGATPTHLMCSPADQWDLRQLLNSQALVMAIDLGNSLADSAIVERGQMNPLNGQLQLIVNPRLTTGCGILMDLSKQLKPFLLQDREPLEFSALEGESDTGFNREVYSYGTRARYNYGYGPWWLAIGFDGT